VGDRRLGGVQEQVPVYFDRQKQRWRYTFNRVIHGQRLRASKLLPAGWTRGRAEAFDRSETARAYAIASGIEREDPLIETAVALYRTHRLAHQRGGQRAERHFAAILPWIHGKTLSQLTDVARAYLDDQRGALAPDTIRVRLAYLKAAARYAWKHHGLTEADPTGRMTIPAGRSREVYLKAADVHRLAAACTDRDTRAIIRIAFYTGLRWISELLPRQPSDLRLNRRQLWLYVGTTKNGSPRMVPVHPAIRRDLRRLPFKRHWRDYYAEFESARKKAGLSHVRMHDLRHSFASAILSQGGNLGHVQAALHHQDAASTKRYSHLYPGELRRIIKKIA